MPQRIHKDRGVVGHPLIGINSQAFDIADPVNVTNTGFLDVVNSANESILGASIDTRTMSATNQTATRPVKPAYLDWFGLELEYGTNVALVAGDIGDTMDIGTFDSGSIQVTTTGAVQPETTSVGAQLRLLERDPNGDGTNTLGVFAIAMPGTFTYAFA